MSRTRGRSLVVEGGRPKPAQAVTRNRQGPEKTKTRPSRSSGGYRAKQRHRSWLSWGVSPETRYKMGNGSRMIRCIELSGSPPSGTGQFSTALPWLSWVRRQTEFASALSLKKKSAAEEESRDPMKEDGSARPMAALAHDIGLELGQFGEKRCPTDRPAGRHWQRGWVPADQSARVYGLW